MPTPRLTPEGEAALSLEPSVNGKRKVRYSLLYPHRFEPVQPTPPSGLTTSSITVRYVGEPKDLDLEVPDVVNSKAGLELMGFTPEVAEEIFLKYEKLEKPDTDDGEDEDDENDEDDEDGGDENDKILWSLITDHISQLDTPPYRKLSNNEIMTKLGIVKKTQDAIFDPEFEDVFGSGGGLSYYLDDTLRIKYAALLGHHQSLCDQAQIALARRRAVDKKDDGSD